MSESKLMPDLERRLRDPAQAFNYASTYAIDLLLSEIDALREKLAAAEAQIRCEKEAVMQLTAALDALFPDKEPNDAA